MKRQKKKNSMPYLFFGFIEYRRFGVNMKCLKIIKNTADKTLNGQTSLQNSLTRHFPLPGSGAVETVTSSNCLFSVVRQASFVV